MGCSDENVSYVYGNHFFDFLDALDFSNSGFTIVENNSFIDGNYHDDIDVSETTILFRYNYLEECTFSTDSDGQGQIIGNEFNNAVLVLMGDYEVNSNIFRDYPEGATWDEVINLNYNVRSFSNNLVVGNDIVMSGSYTGDFTNCIFVDNGAYCDSHHDDPQTFRNCILDFEIPEFCIDGGDNIFMDTDAIKEQFLNYEEGNYYPVLGAVMVDAGYDSTEIDYPFDLGYSERVWDGDFDSVAEIDIGPYEFYAPQGGIVRGQVLEEETSEPVQYAYITLDEDPLLYTFTDAEGNFEFIAPTGDYDLYARRVFYESAIVTGLILENGQYTDVDFTMRSLLDEYSANNDETIPAPSSLTLSNHPNPFNPETTISYRIPENNMVEIDVYNIKGQKVITLVHEMQEAGGYAIVWDGEDSAGKACSSGIYFCRIIAGAKTTTRKMLLLQ